MYPQTYYVKLSLYSLTLTLQKRYKMVHRANPLREPFYAAPAAQKRFVIRLGCIPHAHGRLR